VRPSSPHGSPGDGRRGDALPERRTRSDRDPADGAWARTVIVARPALPRATPPVDGHESSRTHRRYALGGDYHDESGERVATLEARTRAEHPVGDGFRRYATPVRPGSEHGGWEGLDGSARTRSYSIAARGSYSSGRAFTEPRDSTRVPHCRRPLRTDARGCMYAMSDRPLEVRDGPPALHQYLTIEHRARYRKPPSARSRTGSFGCGLLSGGLPWKRPRARSRLGADALVHPLLPLLALDASAFRPDFERRAGVAPERRAQAPPTSAVRAATAAKPAAIQSSRRRSPTPSQLCASRRLGARPSPPERSPETHSSRGPARVDAVAAAEIAAARAATIGGPKSSASYAHGSPEHVEDTSQDRVGRGRPTP